ncbi:MAG: hypothetical protein R3C58_00145 [Parvularculaceae bacterium]
MILRRVIEHVKHQNWTAVALDFVIVVLGVFIGIQVANWNAAQADKRRGADYAQRLAADVSSDLAYRRAVIAYYDEVFDSAERAIALLSEPAPDPKALVVNAYRATESAFAPQTRATWDEIVSSGEIGLLPRAAVERGLVSYFSANDAQMAFDAIRASSLRARVRRTIPHEIQKAIREGCSDTRDANGYVNGFTAECRLEVSDAVMRQAADALKNDADLLSDLTLHFSDLNTTRVTLRREVGFLENASAALGADRSGR